MEAEVFVPVRDYPKYEISNHGNVRNVKTGKILKQAINKKSGYHTLTIRNENGRADPLIHRLVALHFIPNPNNLPVVDHIIKEEPLDNSVSNLRWATSQQNSQNRKKKQNTSSQYKGVSFDKESNKWRAIICIDYKLVHLGRYNTEKEAALAYNQKAQEISSFFILNEIN